MDMFYQTFGFVAAICIGIFVITLFYQGIGYIKRRIGGDGVVRVPDFVKDGGMINIHFKNGDVRRNLRFVGISNKNFEIDDLPYPLSEMVVCETATGAKVYIRTTAVQVIEEVDGSGTAAKSESPT